MKGKIDHFNDTAGALLAYLDSLTLPGDKPTNVVRHTKGAFVTILEAVNGDLWPSTPIDQIDIDQYIARFSELNSGRYKEGSLKTYASRLKRAIRWYSNRESKSSQSQEVANQSIGLITEFVDYKFPLTSGRVVTLSIPPVLTTEDAKRLSTFISSLVIGGENAT